jgi:hypothetical protein
MFLVFLGTYCSCDTIVVVPNIGLSNAGVSVLEAQVQHRP